MIDKKFLKTIDKAVASILEGRLSETFALLRTAAPDVDASGLAADIDKLEKSKMNVKKFSKRYEAYQPFALVAVLLLLLEILLRNTVLRRIP